MSDYPDEQDPVPLMFVEMVAEVFMDSRTARLARALGNSPRNVQKWLAEDDAPPHAMAFLIEQRGVLLDLKYSPYLLFKGQMEEMLQAGMHPEALASILSKLYEELTGNPIR